jgi:hypothetical protein
MRRVALSLGPLMILVITVIMGCFAKDLHVLSVETRYVAATQADSCEVADQLLATRGAWRPLYFSYRPGFANPRPVDELWVMDVEPGWGPPFGEREGFELTLECGGEKRALKLLECPLPGGRRLYVPPQELPEQGTLEEPCTLFLSLRDGEQMWFDHEYSLLLRRDLRSWAAPVTASDQPPEPAPSAGDSGDHR